MLSLEDASVSDFAKVFEGVDVVYFVAGAGGQGGPDRTKKVDYEGAVKVFDAIEGVQGNKPRLILVSSLDARDPDGKIPDHYVSKHASRYHRNVLTISCRTRPILKHRRKFGVQLVRDLAVIACLC